MTLTERKAAALDTALMLSKRRQEIAQALKELDEAMFKQAGAIDLLDVLLAEERAGA